MLNNVEKETLSAILKEEIMDTKELILLSPEDNQELTEYMNTVNAIAAKLGLSM